MSFTVHPTLIVGLGPWGSQVVEAFERRVIARAGELPIVRTFTVLHLLDTRPAGDLGEERGDSESKPELTGQGRESGDLRVALNEELEKIRRLDAVQTTRCLGWAVENRAGSAVVLVASVDGANSGQKVLEIARSLRNLRGRGTAHRIGLGGVFLLPHGAEGETASWDYGWFLSADALPLFDEECYLLHEVNADGLVVGGKDQLALKAGLWLALHTLTPLQATLAQALPSAAFHAFGLAAWEFPLKLLVDYLARRWQREALERLLAAGRCPGAAAAFLERHGEAGTPWLSESVLRFRPGETWASPGLSRMRTLRNDIDEAYEAERARLSDVAARGEGQFEVVCGAAESALAAEVDARLDESGLAATVAFLAALEDDLRHRVVQTEQEAERCWARIETLEKDAGKTGKKIDDLAACFPPFTFRALASLALRPWRLLRLWLLYREIGQRAAAYLAYRQSQWLLQVEAREHCWRAAFRARLAQAALETRAVVAGLCTHLERLLQDLAPERGLKQALADRLEAAALPEGLADHFYRRVAGDGRANPGGWVATYGPLSRWMREECALDWLRLSLEEHAQEQFSFLAELHLDDLLARSYDGAELRRRLATLVDAAAPWWACDEAELGTEARAGMRRLTLVGFPDAGSSMLVDLLPDLPSLSCFSTGDRRQVVAVQVVQGLPLDMMESEG
jgi:hypothetical protein